MGTKRFDAIAKSPIVEKNRRWTLGVLTEGATKG